MFNNYIRNFLIAFFISNFNKKKDIHNHIPIICVTDVREVFR